MSEANVLWSQSPGGPRRNREQTHVGRPAETGVYTGGSGQFDGRSPKVAGERTPLEARS